MAVEDIDLGALNDIGLSLGNAAFVNASNVVDNGDGTYSITAVSPVGSYIPGAGNSRDPLEFFASSNGDGSYNISLGSQYVGGAPRPGGFTWYLADGDFGATHVLAYNSDSILLWDADFNQYLLLTNENIFDNSQANNGDFLHPAINNTLLDSTGAPPTFHQAVPPCFAAGTHLATPDGLVPVEALKSGDDILTASGAVRTIRWIGHSQVRCDRHPRPWEVTPIRIRAHAFGQELPVRDLIVSPGHAIFVGGVLIPAGCLLNGATITQEDVAAVHYFHVELDSHDVLLAEGLPCESYLDDGNRGSFANAPDHVALHGRMDPVSWERACAPCVMAGPQLTEVRQRLLDQAAALGYEHEADADIHLVLDGMRVDAIHARAQRRWFLVPAGVQEVRIVSRSGVLSQMYADQQDGRVLGICISGLNIDGVTMALDSHVLVDGFYALETQGGMPWRWTDGNARLTLPASAVPVMVELSTVMQMTSWRAPVLLQIARAA